MKAEESRPLAAAAWMTGAIVSFSSMAVAGRAVSFELDTFEIMLYRSLVGIVLVLGISTLAGTRGQIRVRRMRLHLMRNVSHFTGQNLWFFAITAAPLAQVFALEFSQPLWVALIAPLVLGEHMNRVRVFAAITGFIGILIVARPGAEPISVGLIAAALAAIGFAGSAITTKLLTRTEAITSILFWLTVMQSAFGLVCASLDGSVALPSASSWPWVAVIACAGLLAHFCLTQALSLAPATVVIPLDFARLPVIAIVGMLIYDEPLDMFVFIGAAVIFSAIYLNVWGERLRRRQVVAQK